MTGLQMIGFIAVMLLLIVLALYASGHIQISLTIDDEDAADSRRRVRWIGAMFLMFAAGFAAGWMACWYFVK